MGGTVSPGRNNDELVDHLIDAEFIRSPYIIRVFRAVDRGHYYHPSLRDNAYKDVAWKMGNLHLSAPCVYSVVMESLKLKPGLSFLNLGSGCGYLSTMVGCILGQYGINHGIEIHQDIVDYAYEKLEEFVKTTNIIDESDFCEPVFTVGNCLTLDSNTQQYDRVYCGAACPEEYESYLKNLIKVNGILIMPLNDRLLKITRVDENTWITVKLLSVSFAQLISPPATKKGTEIVHAKLSDTTPPNLQQICRSNIRSLLRRNIDAEHPNLKQKRVKNVGRPRRQVRRIVIPFFDESDWSNNSSDSDFDFDSDSPEYTITSRISSRVSVLIEDFLRRHAEMQIMRRQIGVASLGSEIESLPFEVCALRNAELTNSSATQTEPSNISNYSRISQPRSDSESNLDKPPSQSTRSKTNSAQKLRLRNTLLRKKNDVQEPSTSSTRTSELKRKLNKNDLQEPSTSSTRTPEPKRKFNMNVFHDPSTSTSSTGTPEPKLKFNKNDVQEPSTSTNSTGTPESKRKLNKNDVQEPSTSTKTSEPKGKLNKNNVRAPSTSSTSAPVRRKFFRQAGPTRSMLESLGKKKKGKKCNKKRKTKGRPTKPGYTVPTQGYTEFLVQKIAALPLPRFLLLFLNYGRDL